MLHIQDMAFAYPGTGEILKKISFDLEEGHCLALLGNNGAGKSTLLKCLNRIHEPKEGVIEVRGQNVHAMKRGDIAKTMAYVAQQSEGTQLTVFDSILLGRKPYIIQFAKMAPTIIITFRKPCCRLAAQNHTREWQRHSRVWFLR